MSSKLKIIIILISFVISILTIRYLKVDEDFSNLALGKETSTVFAKNVQGKTIHVSAIDSLNKQIILHAWNSNGNKDVLLVLGNSQTHSINQIKTNDVNYLEILDKRISDRQIIGNTYPNASLQDFLIAYFYWKNVLPIKDVFIPLFFDDMRELNGINYDFYPLLVNEGFNFTDNHELLNKLNLNFQSKFEDTDSFKNEKKSTQEVTEEFLNECLNNNWYSVWAKRKNVQSLIFSNLYLLRNYIFNINPSSVRNKIPERYFNNMTALDLIINDAVSSKINLFLYIPPIRNDVKLPYNLEDYHSFISEVKLKSNNYSSFIHFVDFSYIVPSKFFGFKSSTSLDRNKNELDFMHFQYSGHQILADSLLNFYNFKK
jgi:hypothetical protein